MKCFFGSCGSGGGSWFGMVLTLAVLGLLGVKLMQLRPAELPPALVSTGMTLDSAIEQSKAEGKPVLAFATAKWCGSCQTLKRNGLRDPEVQALIDSRTVAVTLEETTPDGAAGIRLLPVEAFPTLLLIQDGQVTSKIVGAQSASALAAWLEANTSDEG